MGGFNFPTSEMVRAFGSGGMGTGLGPGGGGGLPGMNQFSNLSGVASVPGNTSSSGTPPGIVPPATTNVPPPPAAPPAGSVGGPGAEQKLSYGNLQLPTFDPGFTNQFYQWLQQQLGKGATPFNLSTALPSGGTTAPGQLNAPLNPIEQSLMKFYETGQGGPMSGVLPMWNAAIAAMGGPQGPIAQQEAMLKGQFAFAGDLASSPFAQAMTQFGEQTALNQNALLTQATLSALPGMEQAGMDIQNLDQQAIQNMLAEFVRTQPEYSPLLNMLFGGATSSPGVMGSKGTGLSGVGAALGGAGSAAQGVADIIGILKGKGGGGGGEGF